MGMRFFRLLLFRRHRFAHQTGWKKKPENRKNCFVLPKFGQCHFQQTYRQIFQARGRNNTKTPPLNRAPSL